MNEERRNRCGYLWVTDEENKRIETLIKSSGVYKNNKAIRTKADFLRFAVIAMGELLKRKKPKIARDSNQEEAINSIVNYFCI